MLPTTVEAVKAILRTDPTVTQDERIELVALFREHGRAGMMRGAKAEGERRILRRAEVARIMARSTRAVDYMASQGIIRKVILPGRKRSSGFVSVEVERLLAEDRGKEDTDERQHIQRRGRRS